MDTHFLTLEKYGQLYERKFLEKQKRAKEEEENRRKNVTPIVIPILPVLNNHHNIPCPDLVEGGSWTSFAENNPLLENILDQHIATLPPSALDGEETLNEGPSAPSLPDINLDEIISRYVGSCINGFNTKLLKHLSAH